MQLTPGQQFPFIWQVPDPTDLTTYYPQVVVQNGITLQVLATLNLASQGGGQYQAPFLIPTDPTGRGYYMTQTLRVYTDVNHTTYSANYTVENREYVVQVRPTINYVEGDRGGEEIDWEIILKMQRAMLIEELESRKPVPMQFPDIEKIVQGLLQAELAKIPKAERPPELDRIAKIEEVMGKMVDVFSNHIGTTSALGKQLEAHRAGLEATKDLHLQVKDLHEKSAAFFRDTTTGMRKYFEEQNMQFSSSVLDKISAAFDEVDQVHITSGKGWSDLLKEIPKKEPIVEPPDYVQRAKKIMGR